MAHKLKIGEKVKIKSWKLMVSEFGLDNYKDDIIMPHSGVFARHMKYMCGTIVTIKKAYNQYSYEIEEEPYWFCDEMFEDTEK